MLHNEYTKHDDDQEDQEQHALEWTAALLMLLCRLQLGNPLLRSFNHQLHVVINAVQNCALNWFNTGINTRLASVSSACAYLVNDEHSKFLENSGKLLDTLGNLLDLLVAIIDEGLCVL